MNFKNLRITNDFVKTVNAKVCYIFKIEKDNNVITKVHYYRDENGCFVSKNADVQWFAMQLILNTFVAYCGKISSGILIDVAKVLPMVKDGVPYLTTMKDDTATNNLVTLYDYYK